MASITVQAHVPEISPIRPLSILRDLPQVADLIELCFALTMDEEGQSYLQQMRRASHNNEFLRWAGKVADSTSLPLSGFGWEENGRIVGNASLVLQRFRMGSVVNSPRVERCHAGPDVVPAEEVAVVVEDEFVVIGVAVVERNFHRACGLF